MDSLLAQDDLVARESQSLMSSALGADVGTSLEICFFKSQYYVFMDLLTKLTKLKWIGCGDWPVEGAVNCQGWWGSAAANS